VSKKNLCSISGLFGSLVVKEWRLTKWLELVPVEMNIKQINHEITLTDQRKCKQHNEQMRAQSKHMRRAWKHGQNQVRIDFLFVSQR